MQRSHDERTYDDQIAGLRYEVHALKVEVATQSQQVKELLEAWNTANGLVRFIKWLASIAVAGSIVYAAVTGKWPLK